MQEAGNHNQDSMEQVQDLEEVYIKILQLILLHRDLNTITLELEAVLIKVKTIIGIYMVT